MKQLITILIIYVFLIPTCSHRIFAQTNPTIKQKDKDSIAISKINSKQGDTIFFQIPNDGGLYEWQDWPKFPDGETALKKYIINNTVYPKSAVKDSIEGTINLRFLIDIDGSIIDVKVIRGVRQDLDDECIRVLKEMPKWEPGRTVKESDKGWYWTTTKCWYNIPFTFSLSNQESKKWLIIRPK